MQVDQFTITQIHKMPIPISQSDTHNAACAGEPLTANINRLEVSPAERSSGLRLMPAQVAQQGATPCYFYFLFLMR